jgi:hypothetical protein
MFSRFWFSGDHTELGFPRCISRASKACHIIGQHRTVCAALFSRRFICTTYHAPSLSLSYHLPPTYGVSTLTTHWRLTFSSVPRRNPALSSHHTVVWRVSSRLYPLSNPSFTFERRIPPLLSHHTIYHRGVEEVFYGYVVSLPYLYSYLLYFFQRFSED